MLNDSYGPDEEFLNRKENAVKMVNQPQHNRRALSVSQPTMKLKKF